jgi:hypothetical protein
VLTRSILPARLRVAAAMALACGALAAPALASSNETVFFEAPSDLVGVSSAKVASTLSTLSTLGVRALRVTLYWENVAPQPSAAAMPAFNQADPSAYNWSLYDPEIQAAHARGWTVLLTVTGPVPKWATAARKDNLTRPSNADFKAFMTAVGKHYGSEVQVYSIWNEPNEPQFLLPQFVGKSPASPMIYRGLWEYGYAGLQAAGLHNPTVLMGETAPFGTGHVVAPLTFLRGALCLSSSYRKAPSCSLLPAAGYAHHAYTKPSGPYYKPPGPNDVTIGVLSRLTAALDAAARAHAVKANLPVYLTEFGTQSVPNAQLGVPLAQQAEFNAMSEHLAFENPRVAAFSQYLLSDDPVGGKPAGSALATGLDSFQTGIETATGVAKPSLFAFRLALVVERESHGRLYLWGDVRPTAGQTSAVVYVQRGSSTRWTALATVHTDHRGYFSITSTVAGSHWELRWTSPSGTKYSGPPIRSYPAP